MAEDPASASVATMTWTMVVFVALGVAIGLAVIAAAWWLVWVLVLRRIRFLRRLFEDEPAKPELARPNERNKAD